VFRENGSVLHVQPVCGGEEESNSWQFCTNKLCVFNKNNVDSSLLLYIYLYLFQKFSEHKVN
jgi:hypothetical protein